MNLIVFLCLLTVVETASSGVGGVVKVVAMAGSDVVLPCSLGAKQDIEPALFDWKTDDRKEVFLYDAGIHYNNGHQGQDEQYKGRVFHFPDELNKGNASIVIRKTRLSDSGNYTCIFPFLQRQQFHIELFVGATPKPKVMILNVTEDQALLQCEVRGAFPKPQVKWTDSDRNILPAKEKLEDSDDPKCPAALTLQTTVTKTGSFHCVLTQQELNHIAEVHIYVHICSDESKRGSSGMDFVPLVVSAVLLIVSAAILIFLMCRRRAMRAWRKRSSELQKDPRHLMETLRPLELQKEPRPLMERHDSGVSSLYLSEKSRHIREYGVEVRSLKAEPDEGSKAVIL